MLNRSILIPAFLALPGLAMQAPQEDAHALVVKYTALIKDYPRLRAEKKRVPNEANLESVYARLARETNPEARQVLLVARQFLLKARVPKPQGLPEDVRGLVSSLDTSLELEMAAQIPPDSPALELVQAVEPDFLADIAWHASGGGYVNQKESEAARKAFAYLEQIFEKHPSREVKALALATGANLYSRPRMLTETKAYVDRLEAFAPGHPAVAKWREWLKQAAKEDLVAPKVGNPVPHFKVEDLDKARHEITPATFKGKYWIMDFWASWCGPCKAELPNLHKAFAKYKSRGLEVLSLSWDKNARDIAAFRKDPQHLMPWHHAFPQGELAKTLNAAFQVRGIPHVLLIGPDGKILATTEALRGEALEQTLEKYLPALK
ncbi:MAG: TlpA family protein disulfide reductase [Acidobacteria bacterium]|nr:TlpA family protein disulfide reductase [Acidobacteriota bacterium]